MLVTSTPPGIVYISALPLIFLLLPADHWFCLCLNKYYCTWISLAFDQSLQKTSPYQDPAARYPLVTEVSVPVSVSAYHQSSLTIDPVDQLLGLRQGDRSIEDYIQKFCELVYQVPLYDETLFKDLFSFGLNEPVKSRLPGWEVNVRLSVFMDYALKLCDSPFTVGAMEEERDAALTHEMTAAPEHAHKMAVTTTPRHVIATSHESSQVTTDHPEPAPSQELAESAPEAAPSQELAESAPEAAPSQELAESAPEAAPSPELAESAPEAAPSQELAESAPEAAPSQELAESAPEAAPSQELAESAPEAAPSQERAESAPEAAPSQELAEFALQPVPPSSPSSPLVPPSSPSSPLVPPSSPSSPLVPPSSPSSPLVPPSSPSPWILSSLALSERPETQHLQNAPWRSRLQSAPLR